MEILPKQFDSNNEVAEMLEELSRLNLELTCLLAFDEHLDSFSEIERLPNSRSSKLMTAAEKTNSLILPLDQGFQLWRIFETPSYRKLRESQEYIERVSVELVEKKRSQHDVGNSLLDQYFKNPNLDVKDLYGMAADLLLAGVHTTSFTTAFALYHLSMNQHVQDLLFDEASKIMPSINDTLTSSIMNSEIPYARAVLKEVFRLNPISIGVGRILNKDTILGGFHVPKNVRNISLASCTSFDLKSSDISDNCCDAKSDFLSFGKIFRRTFEIRSRTVAKDN